MSGCFQKNPEKTHADVFLQIKICHDRCMKGADERSHSQFKLIHGNQTQPWLHPPSLLVLQAPLAPSCFIWLLHRRQSQKTVLPTWSKTVLPTWSNPLGVQSPFVGRVLLHTASLFVSEVHVRTPLAPLFITSLTVPSSPCHPT